MESYDHFRYRRITPADVIFMKGIHNDGATYKEISKIIGVSTSTVQYHLDEECRKKALERSNKYNSNLTKEQVKANNKKRQDYLNKYIKDRYHKDPEFRRKFIDANLKYQKKKRDESKIKTR